MIDTHCHLTDPSLKSQLADVLERARIAGVERAITIGTDLVDDREAIELCRGRDRLRCAIGVHPNYVAQSLLTDVEELREIQSDPSVVALGEMGLDYHYGLEHKTRQEEFFAAQLALAAAVDKPVVIHCRGATDDCLAMMRDFPSVRAVFHCFTGTVTEARQIIDAGHHISYTGAATFKKSDAIREAIRLTPRDRLMLETDAPYLSPEPLRKQKVNEPALVVHTAAVVAREWGVEITELDRITTENAQKFFGWVW